MTHAYRVPLFPEVYDAMAFGVEQEDENFRSQTFKFVALQPWLSHSRLYCGIFQQEPAITALDWLFTPNPKSEEHMHVAPLQTSTKF